MYRDLSKVSEIKSKVTIPMYFYNIIIPKLSDYYSDYTVDFESRPVCKCPLHDEETPSMRYYEETNSFYCFGCSAGGDIIALHRKFTEKQTGVAPSFDDTIQFLYSYFIEGKTGTQVSRNTGKLRIQNEPILNTNIDIIRYQRYTKILDNQLLQESSLAVDKKRIIWQALDETNLLIDKNKLNAIDAVNYIKELVYKITIHQ